jgi:hypothetical protein
MPDAGFSIEADGNCVDPFTSVMAAVASLDEALF